VDFSLSPKHEMIRKTVRGYAEKEIAPVIRKYDRRQEPTPFALNQLGILGLTFPVLCGGEGMDHLSPGTAREKLKAAGTSLRLVMTVHVGLCMP